MPIALSTQSFTDHKDHSVLDEMNPLGFSQIFLGPGLWPLTMRRIRQEKERPVAGVTIFAERPDVLLWDERPLQRLPLLVTDRENRQRTINLVSKTLQLATEVETQIVVVPLLSNQPLAPRKELFDAARAVIEPLIEEAARRSLLLCIPLGDPSNPEENASLPNVQELQALFREFSGAPLRYWHSARQMPGERAKEAKKKEQKTTEQPSILLASDDMIMAIANPLGRPLLPPDALLAQLGLTPPKEEAPSGPMQANWGPEVPAVLVKDCVGGWIDASELGAFVNQQEELLWVAYSSTHSS